MTKWNPVLATHPRPSFANAVARIERERNPGTIDKLESPSRVSLALKPGCEATKREGNKGSGTPAGAFIQ
jgi:hypothetical protein